jgi:hypothetical protein
MATNSRRPTPADSPEARENQLIAAAVDLAEKQILAGTASPSVITHFLRLASGRERLEREKLERENEVLRAKAEALESNRRTEELYSQAIEAMRSYSGFDADDGDTMGISFL